MMLPFVNMKILAHCQHKAYCRLSGLFTEYQQYVLPPTCMHTKHSVYVEFTKNKQKKNSLSSFECVGFAALHAVPVYFSLLYHTCTKNGDRHPGGQIASSPNTVYPS